MPNFAFKGFWFWKEATYRKSKTNLLKCPDTN